MPTVLLALCLTLSPRADAAAQKASISLIHAGVRDIPSALAWLRDILGWKPAYQDELRAIVPAGPVNLMLEASETDMPASIALRSEDVDADYRRLMDHGAVSLKAPVDEPYGSRTAALQGPGAIRLELEGPLAGPATGFLYEEIKPGTGASPKESDTVKVRYIGALRDGTVFDLHSNGRPVMFPLKNVIPCWAEGIRRMKVGGKAKFVCPPGAAYGLKGRPPKIPPGATLLFEVELAGIVE